MNGFTLRICLSLSLMAGIVCAGENGMTVTSKDIIGHKYYLESVDGKELLGERHPYIEFGPDLAFHGQVCNSFRGKGTLMDGVFLSGPILSTRMLCPDSELSQLEPRLFDHLERGMKLTREEGKLVMTTGDTRLVFATIVPPLVHLDDVVGRKFSLRQVDNEDFESKDGRIPFLEFGRDLRLSGTICNNFMASAEIVDGKLIAENAASTMMLCLDEKLNSLESTFHAMLRNGCDIFLDGSLLTLKGEGKTLIFQSE